MLDWILLSSRWPTNEMVEMANLFTLEIIFLMNFRFKKFKLSAWKRTLDWPLWSFQFLVSFETTVRPPVIRMPFTTCLHRRLTSRHFSISFRSFSSRKIISIISLGSVRNDDIVGKSSSFDHKTKDTLRELWILISKPIGCRKFQAKSFKRLKIFQSFWLLLLKRIV